MLTTVEAQIADILLTRLASVPLDPPWAIANPGIAFPGQNADGSPKPMPTSFLEARILMNTNVNDGIADDSSTEFRGILQINVAAPTGEGVIPVLDVAGTVASHFERGSELVGHGLKIKVEGRPSIAPVIQDPGRMSIPVSVSFSVFA